MNHNYTPHQLDPDETLRTVPTGWDFSGMTAKGNLTTRLASNLTSRSFAPQDGLQPGEWQPEKFGAPRTTPRGWDVSNLR